MCQRPCCNRASWRAYVTEILLPFWLFLLRGAIPPVPISVKPLGLCLKVKYRKHNLEIIGILLTGVEWLGMNQRACVFSLNTCCPEFSLCTLCTSCQCPVHTDFETPTLMPQAWGCSHTLWQTSFEEQYHIYLYYPKWEEKWWFFSASRLGMERGQEGGKN